MKFQRGNERVGDLIRSQGREKGELEEDHPVDRLIERKGLGGEGRPSVEEVIRDATLTGKQ